MTAADHPVVFATFTAPSFGPVHSRPVRVHTCTAKARCRCKPEPCPLAATPAPVRTAGPYPATAVTPPAMTASASRFARTATTTRRMSSGMPPPENCGAAPSRTSNVTSSNSPSTAASPGRQNSCARSVLSHGKVAECQARGAVHFHALFRLDDISGKDPDAVVPPPVGLTAADLEDAVRQAANVAFRTLPHPDSPDGEGWLITWGRELDVRLVADRGHGTVSGLAVAGYLAKYATKGTEVRGHASARITRDTLDLYASPTGTHAERLIDACWFIGHARGRTCGKVFYGSLRRWAHMLGFGGHFLTKARRYSVTFSALRQARVTYRRHQETQPEYKPFDCQENVDTETTVVLTSLSYAATGWRTFGDALLANTAADQARKRRQTGREEFATQYAEVPAAAAA
jgi:hypothetical protein